MLAIDYAIDGIIGYSIAAVIAVVLVNGAYFLWRSKVEPNDNASVDFSREDQALFEGLLVGDAALPAQN